MQRYLTGEQITKVELAVLAMDAVSSLCSQIPPHQALDQVSGESMACLLDLIIAEIREGTTYD